MSRGERAFEGVAASFGRSVLMRHALIGVIAFLTVLLLAPWMLLLDLVRLGQLWASAAALSAVAVALSIALAMRPLNACSAVFEALALEPERVEPEHIAVLARLPAALAVRLIAAGALAAALMLVPGLRPADLDPSRALTLAMLTLTIVAAASVVDYVAVREATIRALELGPSEPIAVWLENEAVRLAPQRRVTRKMLLATVAPVALVGVGALLVAHAHLRAHAQDSRTEIARSLARVALEPAARGELPVGRSDAMAAAAAYGFAIDRASLGEPTEERIVELAGDYLELHVPLGSGAAVVRYSAEVSSELAGLGVLIALVAAVVAAALGAYFGNALAADLVLASRQVNALGTESVLRGEAGVGGRARFAIVAELGGSVDALAARFREFAAAQRRALEAKALAQRVKQLLFASVSHDLKSPLNAILGFAQLVRVEHLTEAQRESLDMVEGRGRELLALIETILDAARVEAGQLELKPEPMAALDLVHAALDKAFHLHGQHDAQVVIELARDMPVLSADPARGPAALAVLLADALAGAARTKRVVRVRGTADHTGAAMPRIVIEHAGTEERFSQLELQLAGRNTSGSDRGMVLRLSLARAIVELHGGRVEVTRGTRGEPVLSCAWPAAHRDSR